MKSKFCCAATLVCFSVQLWAQNILAGQGRGMYKSELCDAVAMELKDGKNEPRSVCFERATGVPRCQVVDRITIGDVCATAKKISPNVMSRLQQIALDMQRGISKNAGRQATDVKCTHPLPQGELLLPEDELRIFVTADSPNFQSISLRMDATGARATPVTADFGSGRAPIDARAMRERSWLLTARIGNESAVCKFKVLGGEEARTLIAQYRQINTPGEAGLIERAYFFQSNDFWFEYGQTIDALRGEVKK